MPKGKNSKPKIGRPLSPEVEQYILWKACAGRREMLEEYGLPQTEVEVAELLGVTRQTFFNWRTGRIKELPRKTFWQLVWDKALEINEDAVAAALATLAEGAAKRRERSALEILRIYRRYNPTGPRQAEKLPSAPRLEEEDDGVS